ncbi:hypothetical protein [Citrobacter sp. NCU1]|uniref:hypothetical protein n=1 Tax=Citrobacter sp. NCU1 TaxID=2026683 RepID=UPI001390B01D|nr:hypothetical protein [Citrobacter sp. NCU1]
MKTYAQRDFVNHPHFSAKKTHDSSLEKTLIVWLALLLSTFGGVWILSLIYQFALR